LLAFGVFHDGVVALHEVGYRQPPPREEFEIRLETLLFLAG
jgi:hypothetical protein